MSNVNYASGDSDMLKLLDYQRQQREMQVGVRNEPKIPETEENYPVI